MCIVIGFCLAFSPLRGLAERPLVIVGAGAGFGVEPSRSVGTQGQTVRSTLGMMSFEGSVLGDRFGFLFRMAGTLGSIDYQTTGFDRLSFIFAGLLRPFGSSPTEMERSTYGRWVLSRWTVEAGPLYEWLLAGFSSGHAAGLHLGTSVDFPLFSPSKLAALGQPAHTGPFLRLHLSRPILLSDSSVQATTVGTAIEAGSPVFRALFSVCVGF